MSYGLKKYIIGDKHALMKELLLRSENIRYIYGITPKKMECHDIVDRCCYMRYYK